MYDDRFAVLILQPVLICKSSHTAHRSPRTAWAIPIGQNIASSAHLPLFTDGLLRGRHVERGPQEKAFLCEIGLALRFWWGQFERYLLTITSTARSELLLASRFRPSRRAAASPPRASSLVADQHPTAATTNKPPLLPSAARVLTSIAYPERSGP
eukprot:6198874-Pleurochrysis_carterae.AAC.3